MHGEGALRCAPDPAIGLASIGCFYLCALIFVKAHRDAPLRDAFPALCPYCDRSHRVCRTCQPNRYNQLDTNKALIMEPTKRSEWLYWLDTCPSTNTWAIDRLSQLQDGDVVFTPQQTAGRGQHGRTWHSPAGGLTASVVLTQIPAVQLSGFSLAAGLAVVYAIEELLPDCKEMLRLKWPNDVLFDGRKLAGILCEASASGDSSRVVVGIGLNYRVDFEQAGLDSRAVGRAVSLHQISPNVPDQFLLLEQLRHYLLQMATLLRSPKRGAETGLSALLPALRSRDALLDRFLTLDVNGEQITGQACGISDRGQLLLRLSDSEVRSFISGHIVALDVSSDPEAEPESKYRQPEK